jgi:predicted CXXCH cytochrome family protein
MVLLGRHPKRVIWGLAVATVVAATFLLWGLPQIGRGLAPVTPVVDVASAVDASQCVPCHATLGATEQPGLIFNHGNHLVVSCSGCHYQMPHQAGATHSVPMEVCFTCHGVQHGPQGELATSECRKCHTASFDLLPADHHAKDWAKAPHAAAAKKTGVNGCMMCHKGPKDCDACHTKEHVKVSPMPVYQSVILAKPKPAAVKIYPDRATTMSQCVYCHPDLDKTGAFMKGRLIFAHAAHLKRDFQCTTCHTSFAHTPDATARPDMLSCYRCHGLVHASQGLVAGEACEKCHPPEFDLKPADHTTAFVRSAHKTAAVKSPESCAMCHVSSFCVACHTGKSVAKGGPSKPVVPADHKQAKWLTTHGGLYLAGQGACGSCHDDASCKACHKTVMPHPTNWQSIHGEVGKLDSEDCNVCHTDRTTCQNCHHGGVKDAYLVESACVKCHPNAKQQPATAIQDKGIAEHAVHFNVAKKKGKPYKCYQCHVSFGTSAAAQKASLQQGHDTNLCYGCHGKLDPLNELIAPYPGAQLCVRCHTNLNIL